MKRCPYDNAGYCFAQKGAPKCYYDLDKRCYKYQAAQALEDFNAKRSESIRVIKQHINYYTITEQELFGEESK